MLLLKNTHNNVRRKGIKTHVRAQALFNVPLIYKIPHQFNFMMLNDPHNFTAVTGIY